MLYERLAELASSDQEQISLSFGPLTVDLSLLYGRYDADLARGLATLRDVFQGA